MLLIVSLIALSWKCISSAATHRRYNASPANAVLACWAGLLQGCRSKLESSDVHPINGILLGCQIQVFLRIHAWRSLPFPSHSQLLHPFGPFAIISALSWLATSKDQLQSNSLVGVNVRWGTILPSYHNLHLEAWEFTCSFHTHSS